VTKPPDDPHWGAWRPTPLPRFVRAGLGQVAPCSPVRPTNESHVSPLPAETRVSRRRPLPSEEPQPEDGPTREDRERRVAHDQRVHEAARGVTRVVLAVPLFVIMVLIVIGLIGSFWDDEPVVVRGGDDCPTRTIDVRQLATDRWWEEC